MNVTPRLLEPLHVVDIDMTKIHFPMISTEKALEDYEKELKEDGGVVCLDRADC